MMQAVSRPMVSLLAAVTLAGASAPLAVASPVTSAASSATPGQWRIVYRTHLRTPAFIGAMTAISRSDAWAAGVTLLAGQVKHGFAVHWDGTSWRMQSLPLRHFVTLAAGSSSAGNVWFFGHSKALRWDGSKWRTMPMAPNDGTVEAVVFSPTDAWVTSAGSSMIYRWNGTTWSPHQVPFRIGSISGSPAGDLWAAGLPSSGTNAVVYRRTGSTWARVKIPVMRAAKIAVASDRNVYLTVRGSHPIAWHWNGSRWSKLTDVPSGAGFGSSAIDGAGGLWFGASAHWTAGHWMNCEWIPSAGNFAGQGDIAGVLGTRSSWLAGSYSVTASSPSIGMIEVNGPTP
jgi:hypothetical protein